MNASAAFLDRIDTKFLMNIEQFEKVLEELKKDFYVLKIGGKSLFTYDSVYMDTKEYKFYHDHQAKKKDRTKVRTRLYADSNLAFFEYKQKENGTTRKFRYQFPVDEHGTITKGKKRFFEGVYMSFYGALPEKISPSLRTKYNRLTLCSKDSSERVTIDFNIQFQDLRKDNASYYEAGPIVILESKTMSKDSHSQGVMKKFGISKASSCSKYCLGLLKTGVFRKK